MAGTVRRTFAGALVAVVVLVVATPVEAQDRSWPTLDLDVHEAAAPRGGTFTVDVTGCELPGQAAELRLVADVRGTSTTLDAVGLSPHRVDRLTLTVPGWAPVGAARVEGTCNDWQGPIGGDGGPWPAGDVDPVPVTVTPGHGGAGTEPVQVRPVNHTSSITASGRGCDGDGDRVVVRVQRGTSAVTRAEHMRLGTGFVDPDARGRWSVRVDLAYAYDPSEWSRDPAAPGPLTVFARCVTADADPGTIGHDIGFSYRPQATRITTKAPAPSLHPEVLPWALVASQCDAGTVEVTGTVTAADGTERPVAASEPAGYPWVPVAVAVPLPDDAVHLDVAGRCSGDGGPNFAYAPYSGPIA